MAQTQQPLGSSPLAMANQMQGQGQVYRPQPAITGPILGTPGNPMTPQMLQQLQAANPQMGQPGQKPMPQWGNLQNELGAMTPQSGDRLASMQRNLSAIQGMQPNQIPRMPGMQPPPGAPGQGPGGAKAPGTPGGAQQMKQQMARLPGGPPPGAPAAGPGAGKAPGRNPQMRQQIAQLPGAPR